MRFILIADTPQSLPFAVDLDADNIESALVKTAKIEDEMKYINGLFLIDVESGDAQRLYRNADDSWAVSDTAFRSDLGVATPDEYFQEPETMEL